MTDSQARLVRMRSTGKSPTDSPPPVPSSRNMAGNGNSTRASPALDALASSPASTVFPAPGASATTKNDLKRIRKVRFSPYVNRIRLPLDEAEDAWNARRSFIREAPYHDELWDGDEDRFREKELTPDELWNLKFRAKVSSFPRKLQNPVKRGLKALKSFFPGSHGTGVDQVSAHAKKMKDEGAVVSSPPQAGFGRSLSRFKSKGSSRPLEMYADTVTAEMFQRHEHLTNLISSLTSIPAEFAQAEQSLARYRRDLQMAKEELRKLRFDIPELERRLEKQGQNRTLQLISLAKDEKLRKLQHEYEMLKAKKEHEQRRVERLAMNISQEGERVDILGEKLAELRGAEAEKTALERFVIQECGKEDTVMMRLWQEHDNLVERLEKEKAAEKRLRRNAEHVRSYILADRLEGARKSLIQALQLSKIIAQQKRPSAAPRPQPVSSAPQFVRYLAFSSSSSAESTVPTKDGVSGVHRGSLEPRTRSRSGSGARQSYQEDPNVAKRKQALHAAREAISNAVASLEVCLDELEQYVPSMWTPVTKSWRQEIPDLNHPDAFGSGSIKRRSTGPFELPRSVSGSSLVGGDEPSVVAQAENRISKKLGVINKVSDLAKRYAEFIEREATRTFMRVVQLQDRKQEIDAECAKQEKRVFESAHARFETTAAIANDSNPPIIDTSPAPSSVLSPSGASEVGSGIPVVAGDPILPFQGVNRVRREHAPSISSDATEAGDFETSSMIFPPQE